MMNNLKIETSHFEVQLSNYLTSENSKNVKLHISFIKRLINRYPLVRKHCQTLINDVHSLLKGDYWLSLEVLAENLNHEDDVLLRRCLLNFANAIGNNLSRPSIVKVVNTNVDLLPWYRISNHLGCELHDALKTWDKSSSLAKTSLLNNAQKALKCLKLLSESKPNIKEELCKHGLLWFKSTNHYRQVFKEEPFEDKSKIFQSALFSILQMYKPERFSIITININHKTVDVTDLAEIEFVLVEQLQKLANSAKYKGELEHSVSSITQRFIKTVTSIKKVAEKHTGSLNRNGLDNFKSDEFSLVKQVKKLLTREPFRDLILLLEQHFGHEIYRHDYVEHLLPFYFKKQKKYRLIDYSKVASICPEIIPEIEKLHQSETELLPEKNYDMETLHTRFGRLKQLLLNYIIPDYKAELIEHGFICLSKNKNRIQKAAFQQLQSAVKSKDMSVRSGTSYTEVVRWLMEITGQTVVEAFKISFKRHQRHARRLRIEDLYTDDELKEIVYYVEKGIKEADNPKKLVALYFARIQLKSCWNTAPMADIELSDITDVVLPTAKKGITLLIQKPRKGYDIDTYSLDGRTVNSVMRDIVHVRDTLTQDYRPLGSKSTQKYLFIFKEKTKVSRVQAKNIISHIKSILQRLGCQVTYNSMRIRKNGVNHLYRDVAKQMRAYESANLHTYDTFIKHYQRVSEQKTQQTLHTAVDVMQRYFTGREIDPEIKILMVDDGDTQKTPTGECASQGNDAEASQYNKEHRNLSGKEDGGWCSDFLACVWCKHFRTVADAEHVWQLLSYKNYVLSDMAASVSDIENNDFQQEAIETLNQRVDAILEQVSAKNSSAVIKGKELMEKKGMHRFWAFAVTTMENVGDII